MTSLGPSRTSSHGATVEERVGQVEEVAATGVEVAVRQPVQDRRDGDEREPDPASSRSSRRVTSRPERASRGRRLPGRSTADATSDRGTRVTANDERVDGRRRDADERPRRDQRDGQRPPAAGAEEERGGQQQEHRVVVPQDRREELADDDGHQVRRLGRAPADRAEHGHDGGHDGQQPGRRPRPRPGRRAGRRPRRG